MVPVLALTQNEGPPFCCSRRPAPAAASGTQDPRPLPPGPGRAGRTGDADGRHACPAFRYLPRTRPAGWEEGPKQAGHAVWIPRNPPPFQPGAGRAVGTAPRGRPVTPREVSGRSPRRNRPPCLQTGTGSAAFPCHLCRPRVARFRTFAGRQGSPQAGNGSRDTQQAVQGGQTVIPGVRPRMAATPERDPSPRLALFACGMKAGGDRVIRAFRFPQEADRVCGLICPDH